MKPIENTRKVGYFWMPNGQSKADELSKIDLFKSAGIRTELLFIDTGSKPNSPKPQQKKCLEELQRTDKFFIWSLDNFARSIHHLIELLDELQKREIEVELLGLANVGLPEISGQHAPCLRTIAGLKQTIRNHKSLIQKANMRKKKARGRKGGRKPIFDYDDVLMISQKMSDPETSVTKLAKELNVDPQNIYRYVDPEGNLRPLGLKLKAASGR
ncbi:DNA-invertase (plasmid) [Maritalea myrionectae]|uniref:DNA-invertase n=1 Tax=Maritalea myrionectae TaxID=454601 RepID=A0A2R4MJ34_9HYPH|nr:recombinase family protein [Maritalea myrionectae]AVX06003.1 DNA-invertase [Maritalea myrionectae]